MRYTVGCERPDGSVNIHSSHETCDICLPRKDLAAMSTPDLDAHTPCQCEACRIIDAQDAKDDDLNAWADYNRKLQHELDQLRAALSALATEMRELDRLEANREDGYRNGVRDDHCDYAALNVIAAARKLLESK